MKITNTLAIVGTALFGLVRASTESSSSTTGPVPRTWSAYLPSASEIAKQALNATTGLYTSDVSGKVFDRFMVIWLENTDFDQAAEQEDLSWLATQGITLNNYWATTHPSEPNYIASVGGDNFSLDDDRFIVLPKNISTLADLLDDKGISFSSYQEHLPYSGYQGFNYSNQETFANDYMRKHNPFISYESYTSNSTRLSLIKNFTEFDKDLKNEQLPQYIIITPNMTNDAHDSNINVAGKWSRDFLTPLLENEYFMNNTLILLTFDENETYADQNTVFSLLLGGVIDNSLKGTTDNTFYDHYSQIASAEVNWDLYNLGRNDATANIWQSLANATNIKNKEVDTRYLVNNATYDGYLIDDRIPVPAPNISATNIAGKSVLPAIVSAWSEEYSAQVKADYFTSTTTLVTFEGTIGNAATLFYSEESSLSTETTTASASGSSTASASASASASVSSISSTKSENGALFSSPDYGLSTFVAVLLAMLTQ